MSGTEYRKEPSCRRHVC